VLEKSLGFLKRGFAGIRNVARAALVTYKGGSETTRLNSDDLDDLPFLVQHETGTRRIQLDFQNHISEAVDIDGAAVRQIALNLLLNACAASPLGGRVSVTTICSEGLLRIAISDEGPGLPKNLAALLDPDAQLAAPSEENKGLGLWTTGQLVRRLDGRAAVEYPDPGTRVVVTFPVTSKEMLNAAA
jgi:signal transduction histidine kinase